MQEINRITVKKSMAMVQINPKQELPVLLFQTLVYYSNGIFKNSFKERYDIKQVNVTLVLHKYTLREIFVLASEHGKQLKFKIQPGLIKQSIYYIYQGMFNNINCKCIVVRIPIYNNVVREELR